MRCSSLLRVVRPFLDRALRVAGLGLAMAAVGSIWVTQAASSEVPLTRAGEPGPTGSVVAADTGVRDLRAPATTTTTTVTSTTTTTAPATTVPATTAPATTAPPPAPSAPAEAPAAEPEAPAAAPDQTASAPASPEDRLQAAFERAVPARWRAAIAVDLEAGDGSTSWAKWDGTIVVSASHRSGSDALLENVIAHEFGHLIAFRYGSHDYVGAAPEGWPEPETRPEEVWAKCVAGVFTGEGDHSYGLPPCGGAQLSWAAEWLAADPAGYARTG